MPRPGLQRSERPGSRPAGAGGAPFAGHSVGSIVRPSTSPMVGLYGQLGPAQGGPEVGLRFMSTGRQLEDEVLVGGAPEAQLQEAVTTRLLRRNSHGVAPRRSPAPLLPRPSTSGCLGLGGLDGPTTGPSRPPPLPSRSRSTSSAIACANEEIPAEQPEAERCDMVVEGVHTGEERLVAGADSTKREPAGRAPSLTRSRSFEQGQRDRAAIRKLELEVGRLRGLCESQQKQIAQLREAGANDAALRDELRAMRLRAEQAERQLREGDERRSWQEARSQRAQEELEQRLRDERQRLVTLRSEAEDREVESRIRCRELDDRCESLGRERDELRKRLQELEVDGRRMRDQALGEKLTVESKDREIGDLRNQQRSREAMICQLKAALAEDAAAVERLRNEVREMRDEQVHKEAELIERRRKAEQFQEYVLKICQPHFAVVKDDSLCPVNVSGFQVTEGYVLVPLILLLEGYALLPPQLKLVIDAKSSKLAKGIDYSRKAATTEGAPRVGGGEQSYKDQLFSMMEEKERSSVQQQQQQQQSRGRLDIADKLHVSHGGRPYSRSGGGVAAASSGGWCVAQRGHGNGGKDVRSSSLHS
eukprot:TRINITY_DN15290_c3_g1_i1.p1 TRINITY_DN15290_c3_g1~~TRINITY_DN15290_c3_g1_i1.p1  ORF type:complete len:622 (+),score=234.27 TRINITY_DN15290_c3_g1_i1:94-1866(+)